MGVLTLAGLYALIAIPKESTPDIAIPLGIVSTALPGASASDVERLITDKIEDRVLSVERVSKVTSNSSAGLSIVSVEFDASADIDKSIQLLKDAVDLAKPELPDEATDPVVSDVNFADEPILQFAVSGNLAAAELTALGKLVEDEVERLPGVASVDVSGVRAREVQVILSQEKLSQYQLSVSSVINALAQAGLEAPAGSITVSGVTYGVRFDAGLSTTNDVAHISLAGPGGTPLKLRDVAEIVDGLEDATSYSRVSTAGAPAQSSVSFSVKKSRGGNIVAIAEHVKEQVKKMQETTLAGTSVVITYDGAKEVGKSLTDLSKVGIETMALIIIILLLTLGWREALVAALSVPLSFLIAFIGLLASGNTLNNVSLFSLILAIGILVDSGIVVVEAYHTRLRALNNARAAAVAAINEYAWPLIAGTMTTIVVFIPLFFLSGIVGKFLAAIPFTVIFVLAASIFVALGFVPLLSMLLVKAAHTQAENHQERWNKKASAWYETFLRSFLHNRKAQTKFIWSMVGLFGIAILLPATGLLKSIFFPSDDMDFVIVEIEHPQGTDLRTTDLTMREVEELLYEDNRIESFASVAGSGSQFGSSGGTSGEHVANITVNLYEDRDVTSAQFVSSLRKTLLQITSARITVSEPANGPPSSGAFSVTFSGDDLNELALTAERAMQTVSAIPGVINVNSSAKNSNPEFVVTLDTAKAAERGVSPGAVASVLRTALFSSEIASVRTGSDDVDIRVKLDLNPQYTDPSQTTDVSIDAVRALLIDGIQGSVPLSQIATITYEASQTSIAHEAGTRVMSVTADASADANALDITNEFAREFTPDKLGEGVVMKSGGAAEDIGQSFLELFLALIAGAALMLAILVLEFNSLRHSFYLLLLIPLSLIGVHAGLTLVGQPLSLTSMLGVIALAGVIINHAIILMDSISRIHIERPELSLEDVVVQAAVSRLRPVVLTTVVTVIGMIPLALASAFWAPLAFAIMAGLAFSLLLTLLLIPILYYRWPGSAVRKKYATRSA